MASSSVSRSSTAVAIASAVSSHDDPIPCPSSSSLAAWARSTRPSAAAATSSGSKPSCWASARQRRIFCALVSVSSLRSRVTADAFLAVPAPMVLPSAFHSAVLPAIAFARFDQWARSSAGTPTISRTPRSLGLPHSTPRRASISVRNRRPHRVVARGLTS